MIGTGPGPIEDMTLRALNAIDACDVILGYSTYINLLGSRVEGKEVVVFGMGEEIARARRAVQEALSGKKAVLVSSGDPGIYGMAGPVLEVIHRENLDVDLEIIPGVTALCACSARLGAPIMNDFAVISLSDLLTPWEVVKRRLEAAAQGDLVVVLYNPGSRGRRTQIEEARRILLKYRSPQTWVGIVRGAGREGEEVLIANLASLPLEKVDMQTTVIIGNSTTFVHQGRMVTPRGYREEESRNAQAR
ncbi:MAG: precorrin-3B C17-methyltransferase [Dehalococcoidia bacterium]|nr:precorrin-3B C17-methyltransferase [Dehalococcoidia bacterium]